MVRAYDQGSDCLAATRGSAASDVCLELDYWRTIIFYMGSNTRSARARQLRLPSDEDARACLVAPGLAPVLVIGKSQKRSSHVGMDLANFR
jgi:hypothetical protein